MNCKKCGNVLAPTDTFCKICGEPVNNQQPVTQAPMPTVANAVPPVIPAAPSPMPAAEPVVSPEQQVVSPMPMQQPEAVSFPNSEPAPMPTPMPMAAPTPMQQPVDESNMPRMASMAPTEPVPVIPTPVSPMPIQQPVGTMPVNNEPPVGIINNPNPTPTPEVSTKKKSNPVVVVILLLVLIGVITFIVIYLKKQLSPNTPATNTNVPVVENTETETIGVAWMDYILKQNMTTTLERTPATGENQTVSLTEDELKDIFTDFSGYALVKRYYEESDVADGNIITITYTKNGSNYEVKIANDTIMADSTSLKDEELRRLLESTEHTTENEELKDKEGAFYNYIFDNYESTILDEYFATES